MNLYEIKASDLGITTVVGTRAFTDDKLGVKPGQPHFHENLEILLGTCSLQANRPIEYFLAQRLAGNTVCLELSAKNVTRNWKDDPTFCSDLMVRTIKPADSIIFNKEGFEFEDAFGSCKIDATNIASLIMAADCPGIFIDTTDHIAVVHASRQVLCNDEDQSSGLINTLQKLLVNLEQAPSSFSLHYSYGIGPKHYCYDTRDEAYGKHNLQLHKTLSSMFGTESCNIDPDGLLHIDLKEMTRRQIFDLPKYSKIVTDNFAGQIFKPEQVYIDDQCTASVTDNGDFVFPSHKRKDRPGQRFPVCRFLT